MSAVNCNAFDVLFFSQQLATESWIENIGCKMDTIDAEFRTFMPDMKQLLLNVMAKMLGVII
jgi:hypothetical protein